MCGNQAVVIPSWSVALLDADRAHADAPVMVAEPNNLGELVLVEGEVQEDRAGLQEPNGILNVGEGGVNVSGAVVALGPGLEERGEMRLELVVSTCLSNVQWKRVLKVGRLKEGAASSSYKVLGLVAVTRAAGLRRMAERVAQVARD